MQTSEKDTTIIKSVEQISRILRQTARQYRQDYDDLYQVAAETALRAYDRAQRTENPSGYLYKAIHYEILHYVGATRIDKRAQTLSDHYFVTSLDAPQGKYPDGSTFSLADMLASPTSTEDEDPDYERLYALISALPETCRVVLCMRYGLCGYGVHRPSEIARILGISPYAVSDRFKYAKKMLRKCTELLDLVQSHIQTIERD